MPPVDAAILRDPSFYRYLPSLLKADITIVITSQKQYIAVGLRFKLPILLAGLSLLSGCDAPHRNPFDPESKSYVAPTAPDAITDLTVTDITWNTARLNWSAVGGAIEYQLYHSLPGWDGQSTQNATAYTGTTPGVKAKGSLQTIVLDLPSEDSRSWSVFSRSSDGLISRGSNPVTIVPLRRDRVGTVTASAHSIFQSSWIPPDPIELSLSAVISDSDGVDSVWATTALGDLGELLLTRDGLTWSTQLAEHQVPTNILERLIGYPIIVHYRDRAGFNGASSPLFLTRIIYTPPLIEAPRDTVTSAHPRLSWYSYGAEFLFTYGVDVIFIDTLSYNPTHIYSKYLINSDSSGHTVEDSLYSRLGFYIWTLSVEDEFGNIAYSTEFKFTVNNDD